MAVDYQSRIIFSFALDRVSPILLGRWIFGGKQDISLKKKNNAVSYKSAEFDYFS